MYYIKYRYSKEIYKNFISIRGLINYISSCDYTIGKKHFNYFLDDLAMNDNDKRVDKTFRYLRYNNAYEYYLNIYNYYKNDEIEYTTRCYLVYDQYNRIIDPRYFFDHNNRIIEPSYFKEKISNQKHEIIYSKPYYSSRYKKWSPKKHAHGWNKFRGIEAKPKRANEKRHNAIPEHIEYVRGKRSVYNLTYWHRYSVHTERTWKMLKVKKQYMKKIIFPSI